MRLPNSWGSMGPIKLFPSGSFLEWVGEGGVLCEPEDYLEKIRVSKAGACALNTLAWYNKIGLCSYFIGLMEQSND